MTDSLLSPIVSSAPGTSEATAPPAQQPANSNTTPKESAFGRFLKALLSAFSAVCV
jgi:hypothetical protein